MKNKSIYNMIVCIIQSVLSVALLVLAIIFLSIKKDVLGVVLTSISFPLITIYSIIKSIYYGLEESSEKRILNIICNIISQIITVLIASFIVLKLNNAISWIIFSLTIALGILKIIFNLFDLSKNTIYILSTIETFVIIIVLSYLYNFNLKTLIPLIAIITSHLSNIGNMIENKILMSINLLSIILYGLFLILI